MPDNTLRFSTHEFTAPVRRFKANDPYAFFMDNRPIEQLEENDLFLLDQIQSAVSATVGRDEIEELQPFVNGGDNVVRVRPGRFTARINDVYQSHPLVELIRQKGIEFGELDEYNVSASPDLINALKGDLTVNRNLNLNGLLERLQHYQLADLTGNDHTRRGDSRS